MVKQELLLTPEEIDDLEWQAIHEKFPSQQHKGIRTSVDYRFFELLQEKLLAKAEPLIEKPLREKIDKLQRKLVTTNVYYLREIQQRAELIRKDERERIGRRLRDWLMNHYLVKTGNHYRIFKEELDCISKGEIPNQALKGEGK
ncbi:hypothetical protein ES703_77114 [subsurface metagenome]